MPKGNEQQDRARFRAGSHREGHRGEHEVERVRPSRGRRALALAATLLATAGYAAIMLTGAIRCPLATLFHVPCPTCGATRATWALLRLDGHGVLLNPFAPVLLALLGAFAARLAFVVARDGHARGFDEAPLVRFLLHVLLLVFGMATALWGARFFGVLGGPVPV